jgi:hypothetical protein
MANPDQADRDADAIGDACEILPAGDVPVAVGELAHVRQLSGDVFIKLPRAASLTRRLHQQAPIPGYVPLKGIATVPIGAEVDARRGVLELSTAADFRSTRRPRMQTARIAAGIFRIQQARRAGTRHGNPLRRPATTDLVLKTPPALSKACAARTAPAFAPLKGVVRTLSGSAKGSFRTIGAASTTTVTNATWIVQDRCNGTLTEVGTGRATVYDPRRRISAELRSGQAYLVRARLFAAAQHRG